MENLHVSDNKRYLMKGSETFFWLADTGWLIFGNISEEEAYNYLKNRADKGFNVIQAVQLKNLNLLIKCIGAELTGLMMKNTGSMLKELLKWQINSDYIWHCFLHGEVF